MSSNLIGQEFLYDFTRLDFAWFDFAWLDFAWLGFFLPFFSVIISHLLRLSVNDSDEN